METEDYLPKVQPAPMPAARTSKVGTLVLWVVLICIFFAIYSLFDGTPAKATPSPTVGVASWWLYVAFAVGLLPTGLVLWQLRAARQHQQRYLAALGMALQGNLQEAIKQYRELLSGVRRKFVFAGPLRLDLGTALLRAGQLDEAAAEFLSIERGPKMPYLGDRRASAATSLARVFAIAGDVTKAQLWLDHARARQDGDNLHAQMTLVTAEVFVALRADDPAQALGLLDRHRVSLEATLTVAAMRELWLLEAFAISRQTGPREAAAADTVLRMLSTVQPGELRWMWQRWPALAGFAATMRLGA